MSFTIFFHWTLEYHATAKSLQLYPTLCDPRDGSPPGSPVPGILQARTLEWVAISFSNAWKWKVKGKSLSHVRLLATPWTTAYQAPPSMGFSRQVYWSGMPLPSPRIPYFTVIFVIPLLKEEVVTLNTSKIKLLSRKLIHTVHLPMCTYIHTHTHIHLPLHTLHKYLTSMITYLFSHYLSLWNYEYMTSKYPKAMVHSFLKFH